MSGALGYLSNAFNRVVTYEPSEIDDKILSGAFTPFVGHESIIDQELVDKIDAMLQQNQTLLDKRRELDGGIMGMRRGRITAVILTSVSAAAWTFDFAAAIWEEVQGDNTNKAVVFSVVPLNFLSIVLSAISVIVWQRYGNSLHQAGKRAPEPNSEIETLEQVRNVLIPVQLFLTSIGREDDTQLKKHLTVVAREYEYLPVALQERYPLDWIIATLIYKLPENSLLRQMYEEAGEVEQIALEMSSSVAENSVKLDDEGCFRDQATSKHALRRELDGISIHHIHQVGLRSSMPKPRLDNFI